MAHMHVSVMAKPTVIASHIFDTLGATWWIDAAEEPQDRTTQPQWALNRGSTSVPHARLGSSGRAELRGSYGLVLPGVSGNYASAPDAAALSITGDLDICADVTLVDWTPSANNVIACKGDASTQDSYYLRVNTSGSLELAVINAAGSYITGVSSVAPTVTDGAPLWVRGTVDIDNGANSVFKFYTSSDGSSWTQLGTTQTSTRITTSVRDGTSTLNVGCYASGVQHLTGAIRRVIIKNGYDGAGSTVFDADFTAATAFATSFTESSSNAATVTINATSGADTNDPLLLPHTGTNYLYLPGINGNYATTPDSAALGITGDIDLRCRVALDDWTPAADMGFITKDSSTREYAFGINASGGTLYLYWWNSGATFTQVNSSTAPTAADGDALDVRVTLDVDNGASGRDVKFWTKSTSTPLSDNAGWTQLGTTSTAAGVSSIRDTTDTVGIGGRSGGNASAGKFYRAMILNGIGGTIALDADFTANTNQSSFTESSANAATVTINRATSGRKAVMVTRPVWLFGTDDYMEVADNAMLDMGASQDFALVTVGRQHATWANSDRQISKRNNAGGLGYVLANTSTSGQFETYIQHGGGSGSDFQTGATLGTLYLAASVRSGSDVTTYIGTTGSGTTVSSADLSNSVAMRVGADPDSANYLDGEIVAVAVFRTALSSSDLADIASYFGV